MFLPPTGFSLVQASGGIPSSTYQKFAHPPTWKNVPNRFHHSVQLSFCWKGGGDLQRNFQERGLEKISIHKEVAGKEGVAVFT